MAVLLRESRNGGCELPREMRMQLAKVRDELGWDHSELARRLGITATHAGRIERGMASPNHKVLLRWAKLLGFDVDIQLVKRVAETK